MSPHNSRPCHNNDNRRLALYSLIASYHKRRQEKEELVDEENKKKKKNVLWLTFAFSMPFPSPHFLQDNTMNYISCVGSHLMCSARQPAAYN